MSRQGERYREEFDSRGNSGLSRGYQNQPSWQGDNQWRQQKSSRMDGEGLATALGWFSIGLGLTQLAAPRKVADIIGVPDDKNSCTVIRAVGLRELASGVGLLMQPHNSGWLRARAGGDVMDLALLGAALNSNMAEQRKVTMALAVVLGITVVDVMCSKQLQPERRGQPYDGSRFGEQGGMRMESGNQEMLARSSEASQSQSQGVDVRRSITIRRSPEELYQFWRNFENLPQLMRHLERVEVKDERQSHWTAKAPAGLHVSWDAEIIEDHPNELIAWRSLPGATVENSGSVRFRQAPGDRGTEILVALKYTPPGGKLGSLFAKLFGEEPDQQVYEDLRRLKQKLETGEIVQSEATIMAGPLRPHAAQPPRKPVAEISDSGSF